MGAGDLGGDYSLRLENDSEPGEAALLGAPPAFAYTTLNIGLQGNCLYFFMISSVMPDIPGITPHLIIVLLPAANSRAQQPHIEAASLAQEKTQT